MKIFHKNLKIIFLLVGIVLFTIPTLATIVTANAGADQELNITASNTAVHLVGSGTGNNISYAWYEGTTYIGPHASRWYVIPENGEHNITLKVTDDNGSVATDSMIVTVNGGIPNPNVLTANAGADQELNITASNTAVHLVGTGTGNGTLLYKWYENGKYIGPHASRWYIIPQNGEHNITLKVIDENNDTVSDSMIVTVNGGIAKDLPIFPNAQGFGTNTRAAYGADINPEIYHVTNLDDNGSGSLRYGLEKSNPRVIVFNLSGVISLQSPILIENPYITIAGQTAPNQGVTIKDYYLKIATHDVLIQHIRVRPGNDKLLDILRNRNLTQEEKLTWGNHDAISIVNPSYNIVIDHCSVSWSVDENIEIWGSNGGTIENITISNSISSEGLNYGKHPDGGTHSKGLLIGPGAKNISIIGNLFTKNDERNPEINHDATNIIFANNLLYNNLMNWAGSAIKIVNDMDINISIVANKLKHGTPNSGNDWNGKLNNMVLLSHTVGRNSSIYIENNSIPIASFKPENSYDGDNWSKDFVLQVTDENNDGITDYETHQWTHPVTNVTTDYNVTIVKPIKELFKAQIQANIDSRVWIDGLVLQTNIEIEEYLVGDDTNISFGRVGACPAYRDDVDKRIINDVRKEKASVLVSSTTESPLNWSEANITSIINPFSDLIHPHGDDDNDGYTNLEEKLHEYAKGVEEGRN